MCVGVCAHLRLVKVYGINILIEIENAPQLLKLKMRAEARAGGGPKAKCLFEIYRRQATCRQI